MKHRFAVGLAALILIAAVGCSPRPASTVHPVQKSVTAVATGAPTDPGVPALASRAGLTLAGAYRSLDTTIPASLSGLPWAPYQSAAGSAGYNFAPYRGQQVRIFGYTAREKLNGSPQRLWVVRLGGRIIGAYVTVDDLIPGIFGLDEPR